MEPTRPRSGLRLYAGRKKAGAVTPRWWGEIDMPRRLGAAVSRLFALADDMGHDVCRVCILPDRVEVAIEMLRGETDARAAERVAILLRDFEKAGDDPPVTAPPGRLSA